MNRHLKFLFFLILLVFPFGQVLRWQLPFLPEVRFQPLDFLAFLFVGLWLFKKISRKEKFSPPIFFKEMAVFGVVATFSLLIKVAQLPLKEFLPAFFYLLRLWNYFLLYPALTSFFAKEKLPLRKYLFWEGVAVALLALAQYLFLPDTRFLLYLGWDEHFFRAIGSFLDPAFGSLILVLAFLTGIILLLKEKKPSVGNFLAAGVVLLAIALSFARLSYLCLAIGLGVIFFSQRKFKYFLIFGLFFGLLILCLPKPGGEGVNLWRISSFVMRQQNYQDVWQIVQKHWLLGVGFNAYRYAARDADLVRPGRWQPENLWQKSNAAAGADNSFLFVWATTGVFGLISYLWWWGKMVAASWQARKTEAGLLLLASVATMIISSLAVNSLFYPWILFWLMLVLADFKVES